MTKPNSEEEPLAPEGRESKKRKLTAQETDIPVGNGITIPVSDNTIEKRFGINPSELRTTMGVLEKLSSCFVKPNRSVAKSKSEANGTPNDPTTVQAFQHFYLTSSEFRPLRKLLAPLLSAQQSRMYNGLSKTQYSHSKDVKQTKHSKKMQETSQQRAYLNTTALRQGRLTKLAGLLDQGKNEEEMKLLGMLVPDGHVDSTTNTKLLMAKETTQILTVGEDKSNTLANPAVSLPKPRSCYVCKARYRQLHHFYDQLCPPCAALNYTKRHTNADLIDTVAIVTGSRVKIGLQTTLKLLRAGCTVIATTRFPHSSCSVYTTQPDFHDWKGRLHIYGLDLRDVVGLEAFVGYLKMKFGRVDFLINNACQTIRRPTGYYAPVVQEEVRLHRLLAEGTGSQRARQVLQGCGEFEAIRANLARSQQPQAGNPALLPPPTAATTPLLTDQSNDTMLTTTRSTQMNQSHAKPANDYAATGISYASAMSQTPLLPDDFASTPTSTATNTHATSNIIVPSNTSSSLTTPSIHQTLTDVNHQPIDTRKTNSWLLTMDQVSTPEVLECMMINAIAPFVLNSRLVPLMKRHTQSPTSTNSGVGSRESAAFIINVSAMEGKFYRYKTPHHPHTNMAKAALNMLTRTSAEELASHGIYMNSVDTGWINDENPIERASKTAKVNHFQTPIDEIDAASRILDPIFSALNQNHSENESGCGNEAAATNKKSKNAYGKFYKDYKETEW